MNSGTPYLASHYSQSHFAIDIWRLVREGNLCQISVLYHFGVRLEMIFRSFNRKLKVSFYFKFQ